MSIWTIFTGFLQDLLKAMVDEVLGGLQNLFGDLFRCTFFIEETIGLDDTVLSASSLSSAYSVLYSIMVGLLALKIIWKGINVYILWRDGESETPPGEMILGAGLALITAVAFPLVYDIAVSAAREILDTVCAAMFSEYPGWVSDSMNFIGGVFAPFVGNTLLALVLALVFLVIYVCLIFVMLKQGAELLIYRLGIPFAAVGLVNSDGGAWKPYVQTFVRMLATGVVRHFCLYIGMHLAASLSTMGLIMGVVFEILAFSAPVLIGQFLAPKGGGAMQKVHTFAMAVRTFGGK